MCWLLGASVLLVRPPPLSILNIWYERDVHCDSLLTSDVNINHEIKNMSKISFSVAFVLFPLYLLKSSFTFLHQTQKSKCLTGNRLNLHTTNISLMEASRSEDHYF